MPDEPGSPPDATTNWLLQALPDEERAELVRRGEVARLGFRERLFDEGGSIDEVVFPLDCVLSLLAIADEGAPVEVATIGREGMAGLPAFLGARTSPNASFCQVAGWAVRVPVPELRAVLDHDGALHRQLHRFTQATFVQLAQNVACNRSHPAGERAARWLLMTQDRVGAPTFPLTQDFLGQMLGVRRATVSETAGALQAAGLIRYVRGVITVVDREGLEAASCRCYRTIVDAFTELLGPRPLTAPAPAPAAG